MEESKSPRVEVVNEDLWHSTLDWMYLSVESSTSSRDEDEFKLAPSQRSTLYAMGATKRDTIRIDAQLLG